MSHSRPPPPPHPRPAPARSPARPRAALAAGALCAFLSCKETSNPPAERRPAAPADAPRAADAAPEPAPPGAGPAPAEAPSVVVELDPAGPPGDLAAEVAAFVDLPGCVQRHRPSDALLAEGLEALGYERFTWDACRSIEALKRRRPEPCEAVLSSALRRRCLWNLAAFAAEPALCPLDEPAPGLAHHDVACLAAARRDLRTCAGLRGPARAACEGLLVHDATRCGTDERCARQVARWQNALPLAPNVIPYRARLGVRLAGTAGSAVGAGGAIGTAGTSGASGAGGASGGGGAGGAGLRDETIELADEAAAGAWLTRRSGGRVRLALGEVSAVRVSALPAPAGGLWVEVPEALLAAGGEVELAGTEAGVWLKTAGGRLWQLGAGQGARLRLEPLAAEPHRPLRLTLDAVVGPGDAPRRAIFRADTWLRDVVERAPAPPR